MSNNNRKLLKDGIRFLPKVASAIFEVDDMIAFVAKANTDASVNIAMEKNEIRAGENNAILGTIYSDRTVESSFTSVEWKPEFLAVNTGTQIKVGKFDFMSVGIPITATEDGGKIVVTLDSVPVNGKVYIENEGDYVTLPADSTTVDVTDLGYASGDCITVLGMFKRNGKRIPIGTDQEPLVGKLTLTSPIFEGNKGKVGEAQYVFEAFQFDGNFTQNFTSDSSYEMAGTAIAVPGSGLCGEGDLYGSYQEYLFDQTIVTNYSTILAVPSVIEVKADSSATIDVYGIKNALYDRALIDSGSDLVFSIPSAGNETATVDQNGLVKGVAKGNTTVEVVYNGKLKTTVDVNVN